MCSRSDSESSASSRFSCGWEYQGDAVDCLGITYPPKLTDYEQKILRRFTFDRHPKYKEWNDIRVYQKQTSYRFYGLVDLLKFPYIPLFSSVFSVLNAKHNGYRTEKFLQRRICQNLCNWDPSKCFLENSHSGKLSDLMHKSFHNLHNPEFESKFEEDKSHLRLQEDEEHHPKLFELIDSLGISSKLTYNIENSAVNFDYLTKQFRDDERPLFIMEEKKVNDIIEGLLEVTKDTVNNHKEDMTQLFMASSESSGKLTRPILSLMMWGPQCKNSYQTRSGMCELEIDSWNRLVLEEKFHDCKNLEGFHHWRFCHSSQYSCSRRKMIKFHLTGPVMTKDLTVVYPCNIGKCCIDCECKLCNNTRKRLCVLKEHRRHMHQFDKTCLVQQKSQCQDHWVSHPENFNMEEDIFVEKNIFFHNKQLMDQPRNYAVDIIRFAGIQKNCQKCKEDVYDHFRNHLDIHSLCKFCSYQLATLNDSRFWEKVCNKCGKIMTSQKSLNWHKKIHNPISDQQCPYCEVKLRRKFTFIRHMKEEHGEEEPTESIEAQILKTFKKSDIDVELTHECVQCRKKFKRKRYLDYHIKINHEQSSPFECVPCRKNYKFKKDLKNHMLISHNKQENVYSFDGKEKGFKCPVCGKQFTRSDNLKTHLQLLHTLSRVHHTCEICGIIFSKKSNLTRHTSRKHMK